MKSPSPPRLAVWLLEEFGPRVNQEVLIGDLNEGFQQGRSKGWYWRQVLAAIRWRRELFRLLFLTGISWYFTLPRLSPAPPISRYLDVAIFVAVFLLFRRIPGLLRGRVRAALALTIMASFWLLDSYNYDLAQHYAILRLVLVFGLVFPRKKSPSLLIYRDARTVTAGLVGKLHLAMMQETDPELRRAYAESIAALRRNDSQGTTAVE
jgi:hypothetical protein